MIFLLYGSLTGITDDQWLGGWQLGWVQEGFIYVHGVLVGMVARLGPAGLPPSLCGVRASIPSISAGCLTR